jgi:uncharacterized repeat protein (TIGR03803 family)
MKPIIVALSAGIAGCSFIQPVLAAEAPQAPELVLHSFGSSRTDGGIPLARLLDVNGVLYGTTLMGGDNPQGGTVFSVDPITGAEHVIYSFCSGPRCSDGGQPRAGLIDVSGVLYGTTDGGGAFDAGAVYLTYPGGGREEVIYSFCSQPNCADGQQPDGELLEENGLFYGTASGGGANGQGVVYVLDPNSGQEKVLHAFAGPDGASPRGALIDVNGMLYGTTEGGGANNGGTVFALDPVTGAESVLYSFCSRQNCVDGQAPVAGLVANQGLLYGTTYAGGANGGGTVFATGHRAGTEQTLYSFCSQQNCADGSGPYTGLTRFKHILYGTTIYGGGNGKGTLFALDPATGTETQIYAFCSQQNCTDGAGPAGGLIHANGHLYGTTADGGASTFCQGGCGSLFALKP